MSSQADHEPKAATDSSPGWLNSVEADDYYQLHRTALSPDSGAVPAPVDELRAAATTLRETGESPEICEPLADLLDEIAAEAALQAPDAPTILTLHLDTALAVARAVVAQRMFGAGA